MNENSWSHIGIIALVLTPVIAMWWDQRKHSTEMHKENSDKLSAIDNKVAKVETKIEPIWDWWNKTNGNGEDH